MLAFFGSAFFYLVVFHTVWAQAVLGIPGGFGFVRDNFIVRFSGNATTDNDITGFEHFIQQMQDAQVPFRFAANFTVIFKGACVEVDSKYEDFIHTLDAASNVWPMQQSSINVRNVLYERTEYAPRAMVEHQFTGVDRLHQEFQLTGKGVKIGILDSGIDYTHPAFGGCFKTSGCRLETGYDFVGDNFNGTNLPEPDDNPLDNCYGHGTHVAGIIAGNHGEFRGVAPDATLGIYRVLGCDGSTNSGIVMQALEKACLDGMQVINLSLGFPGGWIMWSEAQMVETLAQRGIKVVAAVGNDGMNGLFTMNSPAVSPGALAVAAMEMPQYNLPYMKLSLDQPVYIRRWYQQNYFPSLDVQGKPLRSASQGGQGHLACEKLGNLADAVVLVESGGCSFADKVRNIAEAGGAVAVFYSNETQAFLELESQEAVPIPAFSIYYTDAQYMLGQLAKRSNIPVFISDDIILFNSTAAYSTPGFSSMGPTPEGHTKADISGPAVNILSAVPKKYGSYGIITGTSMASPYVAGVVALLIGAKKINTTEALRSQLVHTARPQRDGGTYRSVAQQGGGLVDAYAALLANVSVGTLAMEGLYLDSLIYENTMKNEFTLNFTNRHSEPVTYDLQYEAGTAVSSIADDKSWSPSLLTSDVTPKVKVEESSVTVKPGDISTVSVVLDNSELKKGSFFVYSGFLRCTPQSQEFNLTIPLLGMAYESHRAPALAPVSTGLPCLQRYREETCLDGATTFTFSGDSYPQVAFRLNLSVMRIRIRVSLADTPESIHASVTENHYMYQARNLNSAATNKYQYVWDGRMYHHDTPNTILQAPDKDYALIFYFYVAQLLDPIIYTTPIIRVRMSNRSDTDE